MRLMPHAIAPCSHSYFHYPVGFVRLFFVLLFRMVVLLVVRWAKSDPLRLAGIIQNIEIDPIEVLNAGKQKTKIRLYKTLVRPIVLYACGAWASTKSDENKLRIFERKVLRRIFGPKRNDEGNYEIRSNRELNALYNESNIVSTLKSQRIRWAGHVWRAEDRLISTITKWKPDKSRPRGRPRQRWEDRVKEDLKMLGVRNGEEQAAHRETWKEIAEAAMGLNGLD
ncbi:uncharacterized protein LOC111034293 [Myzus persicae]|uniref:uncharacterized protein LOC111034293 n=1 Tax=Myzus persicae TaxID=13164 RepID=UPI000B939240|nr:uncharacterized protein LOC111034293 [Myzus persicae]